MPQSIHQFLFLDVCRLLVTRTPPPHQERWASTKHMRERAHVTSPPWYLPSTAQHDLRVSPAISTFFTCFCPTPAMGNLFYFQFYCQFCLIDHRIYKIVSSRIEKKTYFVGKKKWHTLTGPLSCSDITLNYLKCVKFLFFLVLFYLQYGQTSFATKFKRSGLG